MSVNVLNPGVGRLGVGVVKQVMAPSCVPTHLGQYQTVKQSVPNCFTETVLQNSVGTKLSNSTKLSNEKLK